MKLATIETIAAINPHPNADRLELATVKGWQAIVKKGEFKAGDPCVFIVIDTILPDAPWSAFLKDGDKPIRLRTVKLRGQFSQGLVLPITVLPEESRTWHAGADVGGELGVKKYEKEISSQLSGVAKGEFPTHIVARTDEDNGLNYPELVAEVLRHHVVITQKLDGSSCTIIIEDGEIVHVCSRNLSLVDSEGNAFWRAARKLTIPKREGRVILQGELMGPGIQGNQLGLTEPTLYVFSVIEDGRLLKDTHMRDFCLTIGAEVVRRVGFSEGNSLVTLEELQRKADALTLDSGEPAEGIVIRADGIIGGSGRPLSFKIINRNYGE